MPRRILYLMLMLVLTILWSVDAQASPNYQGSTVLVRVCYNDTSCAAPNDTNSHLTLLDPYTEQVLANEWHAAAGLEALKAGVIAIRTFAYRNPGCGAFLRSVSELVPPYASRLLDNRSQVYRFGGYGGSQNTITLITPTPGLKLPIPTFIGRPVLLPAPNTTPTRAIRPKPAPAANVPTPRIELPCPKSPTR
jgi:hypothetical protein